jgi:hypothetical protein
LVLAAVVLPRIPSHWLMVDGSAAARLSTLEREIPPSAEVVASQGVVGRFAGRQDVFTYYGSGTYPVMRRTVVFVITPDEGPKVSGNELNGDARAAVAVLESRLGARVLADRAGVYGLEWSPGPHVTRVTLP